MQTGEEEGEGRIDGAEVGLAAIKLMEETSITSEYGAPFLLHSTGHEHLSSCVM